MNTFSVCLCILVTIIIKPSSSTLSDLFGGQDTGPPPQVRQMQQFGGQLGQQLQQLAPNPAQILSQIGQYGPQLLQLANQAQKFFSEDDNDSPQQQSPLFGRPSIQQGQGQGQRFGPLQQQQARQQQSSFNLNKFSPQSQDGGDSIYYGPSELESPPEVVHVHRHIIEHRGQSGYGGNSLNNQNGEGVRVFKIIHEQGNNALGNGNGYGYGYGKGIY